MYSNLLTICYSGTFSRKVKGAKGLSLQSILEETYVLEKHLGMCELHIFFMRKIYKKVEAQVNCDFLNKKWYIWPLISLLLLRICQLDGTFGGTLPFCPL